MKRLRIGLIAVLLGLLALLTLAVSLWLWSGSSRSLATALQLLARALPADQSLSVSAVSGSLREGGHIGQLRWQQGALQVEADGIDLVWSWPALLQAELRLRTLQLQHLRIDDRRASATDGPPGVPTDLVLPIRIDAPIRVDALDWNGDSARTLTRLALHYRYDGSNHVVEAGQVRIAAGDYRFAGRLQAQAPMALQLDASGTVSTTAPGAQPVKLTGQARLGGALAGAQARLALQLDLSPEPVASPAPRATSRMQASLSAQIAPWQAQPIVDAQASWQALDLSMLWPQAPRTQLDGGASVTPESGDWRAQVQLHNAASGPLDHQGLPLRSLDTTLRYRQGQWLMQSLQANGAGGSVQGSGQVDGTLWRGQARVSGIDPAAIDTRLEAARISGSIAAQQTAHGISFDTRLTADATAPRPTHPDAWQALRLQAVQLKGLWTSPLLTLQAVQIDTADGRLQGRLSYQTRNQASSAQLALQLPGLQASVDGRIARADGLGTLDLQLRNAQQAQAYLTRWPALAQALQGRQLRGTATLQARWQGGWQNQARGLQLDAALRLPQFDIIDPADATATWQLRDARADLDGTLAALTFGSQGSVASGRHSLRWQTQARGGRSAANSWQARVKQLRLDGQDTASPGTWTVQADTTAAPLALSWQASAQQRALTVSAGQASLQGPSGEPAQLRWQAGSWAQAIGTRASPARWQSQGQISSLPLSWLDRLGQRAMADLGLSSDLLLSGHWEVRQEQDLRAQIRLERSAGDLRLQTDERRQSRLPAGMREAALQIDLVQNQLAASLRWDSERAGRALVAFSTQLRQQDGHRLWPDDAPVAASVQLQLPPVDAWSALAPPGWRLRGTMDTQLSLDGTRQAPNWSGNIQARNLAVRSAVDGIDFSQGTLDAHMHGRQLVIERFTVQGAGSAGGQLSVTGSIDWLGKQPSDSLAARVHMALVAKAQALRLNSLPDRRLAVSGELTAELDHASLRLRGALSADQALLTLPDDSAPQLGDDVRIRSASPKQPVAASPGAPAPDSRIRSDVQVDLDLGRDFQIRGRGLEARLRGKVTVQALDQGLPRLEGLVRTVDGSYKAYGQRLDIEQGVLRFTGAPDNPALDILAIRPNLTQRVGVQISGTTQSPVVRLYADPDLPDAEKLAWLLLGRSGSSGGAEAAMVQQAALALLGGNRKTPSASLAQALGLDELSLSGNSSGSASGTSVTLGKRLSNRFYVAFESGVNGAMGVFSIFYDLSRRFTLRAQSGEHSAIDLIFTLRYD